MTKRYFTLKPSLNSLSKQFPYAFNGKQNLRTHAYIERHSNSERVPGKIMGVRRQRNIFS